MITYITLAQVKAAGLEAFRAGRLQAQDPTMVGRDCQYSGPCVIGAAFSADVVKKLAEQQFNSAGIRRLMKEGVIGAPPAERDAICRLQQLHDHAMANGFSAIEREEALKDLEAALAA